MTDTLSSPNTSGVKSFFGGLCPINLRLDIIPMLSADNKRYAFALLKLHHRERRLLLTAQDPGIPHPRTKECREQVKTVSRENTEELKTLIERYGWPTISRVGVKAARSAWMIVQHSDHDHMFQRRYLDFMKEAVPVDEADSRDMAYLIDRIYVSEGRRQVYGTQVFDVRCQSVLKQVSGEALDEVLLCIERTICPKTPLQPFPIRDLKNVDSRRREVGLGPLSRYILDVNNCYLRDQGENDGEES